MQTETLLDKAIILAVHKHSGTKRKGKEFAYIVHPMEAVAIVATMTSDEEVLAAAVLHDVVEDTDVTLEDIERDFGKRVAKLVDNESEKPIIGRSEEETWHERKLAVFARLKAADRDSKMVALADKLSNMRQIARDYAVQGDALWKVFHIHDPKEHAWHYRGLVESLSDLRGTEAFEEFSALVERVFGK
jgi:(p)ppGpp synthase/HD superfamily hydrolase